MRKTRALFFIPIGLVLGIMCGVATDKVFTCSMLGLIIGVLATVIRQGLQMKK